MWGCTREVQDQQHSSAVTRKDTGGYDRLPLPILLEKDAGDQAALAGGLGSLCSFKSGGEVSPSILQQTEGLQADLGSGFLPST